jgi:hypothetical protein
VKPLSAPAAADVCEAFRQHPRWQVIGFLGHPFPLLVEAAGEAANLALAGAFRPDVFPRIGHVGDLANDVSAGTLHHRIVWAIPSLIDHSARRPSFQSCLQLVKVLKLQSKMPRSIH